MTLFRDSLGYTHNVPEPLMKAFCPAPAEPPNGAFRALVDELRAFRERRRRMAAKVKVPTNTRDVQAEQQAERVSRADHMPTVRQRPAAKTGTVRKSFATMADELDEMANATRARTAEVQRRAAIQMLDDLSTAARAGRLDALSAAKVDALRHQHATALGLTATGIRP